MKLNWIIDNWIIKKTKIRGSMPMFWSQKANLKYKPSIKLDETKNHVKKSNSKSEKKTNWLKKKL